MASPITPYSITSPGYYGLNTQDGPVDMEPKFALEANNCIIDKSGRVVTRKGWEAINTTNVDLGTAAIECLDELIGNDGSTTTLCAGNNLLFKVTGTTLTTLTYGGGGVAPTITENYWQTVMLNGAMLFFQRGHDTLLYDPVLSTTAYRRLSEHPLYTGTVPQAHAGLSAYGRIWCADTTADKNTVTWSDTLSYMVWTGGSAGSLNLYGVWPNGGDEIIALAAHNNSLIIFGKQQTLIYTGANNPTDMALSDAIASGCYARDSVQMTPSDIIYLSAVGVTSIKRTIQEKSAPLGLISRNVNDDIQQYLVNENLSDTIKSAYSPIDSFYLLSFTNTDVTYCFDMRSSLQDGSSRVTLWLGIAPKCYSYSVDKILRIGFAGYVGNHSSYMDNGATYRMSYYSPWIDFGDPIRTSILKKIIMTLIGAVNQTVVYKWGFDYVTGSSSQPTVVTGTSIPSEYGVAEYGISEYSANIAVDSLPLNASGSGKVIQVGFECQVVGFPISVQRVDIFTKNGAYTA